MEKYLITASVDGVDVDFETELGHEPNYYEVYDLCEAHGCSLFFMDKLDDKGNIIESDVL